MPFSPTGVDVALQRNDSNGKFDLVFDSTGNPQFDNTRAHAVLTTLLSRKGEYYWDEAGNRGTRLHTIKQDRLATGSQLVNYAEDGGQQLIDSKKIATFSASATRLRIGAWRLDFSWSLPAGQYKQSINL